MKLKTINIHPTEWKLDVILGGSERQLKDISIHRYGLIGDNWIGHDECSTVETGINSDLKGSMIFVISLRTKNKKVIVHELIHLLWHISKYVGLEMDYNSQEWQAVLFEYLFAEITNNKDYKLYERKR